MKTKIKEGDVFGEEVKMEVMEFNKKDSIEWKRLFDMWKKLKLGMRGYNSREPNFPEGLSEVAFCLYTGSTRVLNVLGGSSSSFDTYNFKTQKAEQIKATSIEEDLTSFGPRSVWDDLYFLDFYNDGKLDGRFNIYKIPTSLIYSIVVNKGKRETFKDQQDQGRRPRFSITKEIIKPGKLRPLGENIQIW